MNSKSKEVNIDGTIYVPKDSIKSEVVNTDGLKMVMVRTYSAGVHYGYLAEENDTLAGIKVKLLNSRRVWSWSGAASLSQLATEGTSKPNECKMPCVVNENTLIAIEIIPMTSKSIESLNSVKIWKE